MSVLRTAPHRIRDMDFEQARFNMIEQQIRPWNVLDQSILDLLATVKREEFVSPELKAMAFSDLELPIKINGKDSGQVMLAPKVEARLLQELAIKGHESALEVGTGTGYTAAMLAHKAASVVSADIRAELTDLAKANLNKAGIANVKLVTADAVNGLPGNHSFDVILVSGFVPLLPQGLLAQLKIGGRLVAIVGEEPVMNAQLVTRTSEKDFATVNLFETIAQVLDNAPQPERFHF